MAALLIRVDAVAPRAALERLAEVMEPAFLLKLLGGRLLSYVDESFRTAGRGRWQRLAWSTLAQRKRGGDEPLQDTGMYRQSFVQESDGSSFVEVGTAAKTASGAPLGKIHEEGTKPYTIRVRNARVLAAPFGSGTGGAAQHAGVFMLSTRRETRWSFFGKEVHHPGVPARPVLPQNEQEAEVVLRPTVEGALERALKGGGANG